MPGRIVTHILAWWVARYWTHTEWRTKIALKKRARWADGREKLQEIESIGFYVQETFGFYPQTLIVRNLEGDILPIIIQWPQSLGLGSKHCRKVAHLAVDQSLAFMKIMNIWTPLWPNALYCKCAYFRVEWGDLKETTRLSFSST